MQNLNVRAVEPSLDNIRRWRRSLPAKYRDFPKIKHWNYLVLEQSIGAELLKECIKDISFSTKRRIVEKEIVSTESNTAMQ